MPKKGHSQGQETLRLKPQAVFSWEPPPSEWREWGRKLPPPDELVAVPQSEGSILQQEEHLQQLQANTGEQESPMMNTSQEDSIVLNKSQIFTMKLLKHIQRVKVIIELRDWVKKELTGFP